MLNLLHIVRDPRWGRAQEVYSEDPLLSSRLTTQFVKGMQYKEYKNNKLGDSSNLSINNNNTSNNSYLLVAACCKHFGAYDIEDIPTARTKFNAIIDSINWAETYSPVFYSCIHTAKAAHVMCSYNC